MKYILIILALLFLAVNMQAQDISWAIERWKIEPLTTSNVARAIIDLQIENPVMVFKQTIKESGWKSDKTEYKSKLALIGNNLFGMRKATQRLTSALTKTYCGYATYSHWIYSVLDYKYWQESKPQKKNECYKKYLVRRGYARNTKGYISNLNQYILPENITEILNNDNYERKINYYFACGSYTATARLFSAVQTSRKENCLCRERIKRHSGNLCHAVSGADKDSRQSKNYLQGNTNGISCLRYSLRDKAIHSRSRYSCERYVQHQI